MLALRALARDLKVPPPPHQAGFFLHFPCVRLFLRAYMLVFIASLSQARVCREFLAVRRDESEATNRAPSPPHAAEDDNRASSTDDDEAPRSRSPRRPIRTELSRQILYVQWRNAESFLRLLPRHYETLPH